MYSDSDTRLFARWVAPFGVPRIYARSQLPVDFRSPLRPSSPPDAKAFTICPSYLDLYSYFFTLSQFVKERNSKALRLRARPGICYGGGERDRTDDPLLAKQVLSQLSYTPRQPDPHQPDHGGPGRI